MLKRLPSPAMVVACLALFVAMGGTGYAATHLSNGPNWATAAKKGKRNEDREACQGPLG